MNPVVQAAWIALIGAVAGVASAVFVAWFGFRRTREITKETLDAASANIRAEIEAASDHLQAQIEADSRSRLWERRRLPTPTLSLESGIGSKIAAP